MSFDINELERSKQEASEAEKTQLYSYPVAKCLECGAKTDLLRCESGHGKTFCRECLSAERRDGNQVKFKVRCLFPTCNFYPVIPR